MFKIGKKSLIKRTLFALVGICLASASIIGIIKSTKEEKVDATTAGSTVTISLVGNSIPYGNGYATNWFQVQEAGGGTRNAMCADPMKGSPAQGTPMVAQSLVGTEAGNLINLVFFMFYTGGSYGDQLLDGYNNQSTEIRYSWAHAIVGGIFGDYYGLTAEQRTWTQNKVAYLRTLVGNSEAWNYAQYYQSFLGDPGGGKQRLVWADANNPPGGGQPPVPQPIYGHVVVTKQDSETGSSTPQGNATFDGIRFSIDGNGVSQSCTLSGGNPSCGFYNLPEGSYTVTETSTNASYPVRVTGGQNATISSNGQVVYLNFRNTAQKGDVTVNKIDAETGSCTAVAELTLSGAVLRIINNSTNPVYYGGRSIARGAEIDRKTIGSDCQIKFSNLPYGNYIIEEVQAPTGYVLSQQKYNVTIPTSGSVNVSTTVPNQVIRGDLKFTKMDATNRRKMANTLFSIARVDANKNIKEIHILVTDENADINTATSFIPHSVNTNGYDTPYNEGEIVKFEGYGSWFGIDNNGNALPVNDSLGALHYGTYIIQELRCDANFFCTNIINQHHTIEINQHEQVLDLVEWDNDCWKFEVGTTAVDLADGDHYIEENDQVTIIDKIDYCVKPNVNYTIKGILMDRATGQPLLINGQTVENQLELNMPTDACGTVEMPFTFNASDLGGHDIVVFEELYWKDIIMAEHKDIDDEDQTVQIVKLRTFAVNSATGDKLLPFDEDVEVTDTVKYCLRPNVEYTVKGIMMDKSTGNGLLDANGNLVEAETTFTPTEACGDVEMIFTFNTTGLKGKELVIFESLYDVNDDLILEHKDINNSDETVMVETDQPPVPDTGFFMRGDKGASENVSPVIAIVGTTFVAVFTTYIVKRKRSPRVDFVKK